MKKNLMFLFVLFCCHGLFAQEKDSIQSFVKQNNKSWNQYNPERGFFQKAFADEGDPRFMMSNEDETFSFGIGGVLQVITFYDFIGSLENKDFSTWNIPIPTNHLSQYGMNIGSTKINFKSRSKLGRQNLIAFISLNTPSSEDRIKLRQAYISWGDVTIGKTYSFFMDLAAGPMTVDLQGPNTQISLNTPLIGYTHPFGKWTFAVAMEMPKYQVPEDFLEYSIENDFQSSPDFTAHVHYKTSFGHLQLGFLTRRLHYWVFPEDQDIDKSKRCSGNGVSLSGLINITPKCFFTFQGIYGTGIAQYINDFGNAGIDLVLDKIDNEDPINNTLTALPTYGGYGSIQYNWNKKFQSALIYGLTGVGKVNDLYKELSKFDLSQYAAVNLFYKINDYCTCGIEYLHGYRQDFVPNSSETEYGCANRLNAMFSYTF